MPYRNIFIANEAKLSLKMNQLIVNNGEIFSFPIEDIRCLVVDNKKAVLTARLVSFLAENGVCLILCDTEHMPSAELLPIGSYCRLQKRLQLQIKQSQPKLKRLWQKIVIKKIQNQAKCLELLGKQKEQAALLAISKSVSSGDTTNREGYAASLYFKALFGKQFTRGQESEINASLNYGYAVFRAFIARHIVAYGLEPSFGIHHKNQLNAFNLADDIIEPFRPIVDLYTALNYETWEKAFDTAQKAELVTLLNCAVSVCQEHCSAVKAIELFIQSLISCFEDKEAELKLPDLEALHYFDYE